MAYRMGAFCGGKLRKIRKRKGVTLERIAAELEVTVPTVRNWEEGKTEPSYSRAYGLAVILGVEMPAFGVAVRVSAPVCE